MSITVNGLDNAALQAALDAGERDVYIPAGEYTVTDTLYVHSHTHIHADAAAHLTFIPGRPMVEKDFLISNADIDDGNTDITVEGGIWDGGFGHEFNVKNPDLFAPNACSGACMNFVNVKGLKLIGLTVANSIIYNIRLGRVRDFEVRDISFFAEKKAWNQDGVHLSGYCRNGIVENIRAISKGQTNDDLIAINADDSTLRLENRGLMTGPIEDVVIRNIYAEDCHTAIRLSNVTSLIKNVLIENVYAGVRCYALNMDAARYCRTPLFLEASAPNGVGYVENVRINNFKSFFTEDAWQKDALISLEQHCDGVQITGFERLYDLDKRPEVPTVLARNLTRQVITADGETTVLDEKAKELRINGQLNEMTMTLTGK